MLTHLIEMKVQDKENYEKNNIINDNFTKYSLMC